MGNSICSCGNTQNNQNSQNNILEMKFDAENKISLTKKKLEFIFIGNPKFLDLESSALEDTNYSNKSSTKKLSKEERDLLKYKYIVNSVKRIQRCFKQFQLESESQSYSLKYLKTSSDLQVNLIRIKNSIFFAKLSKNLTINDESIIYNTSFISSPIISFDITNRTLASDYRLQIFENDDIINNNNNNNNKTKFLGKKIKGQKEGFCIETWQYSQFKGYYRKNKANSLGLYSNTEGDIFICEFTNDKAFGFGIFKTHLGANYVGYWEDNNQHGFGTEVALDSSNYIGEYSKGKKNGFGSLRWADGSKYSGYWANNLMRGYGEYTFSDGRVYSGSWRDNVMNGYGEFTWTDGRKYFGYYLNDTKEGFGIFYWEKTNKFFIGFWKNGKQDGVGEIITANNIKYGLWQSGVMKQTLNNVNDAFIYFTDDQIPFRNMFLATYKFLSNFIILSEW